MGTVMLLRLGKPGSEVLAVSSHSLTGSAVNTFSPITEDVAL